MQYLFIGIIIVYIGLCVNNVKTHPQPQQDDLANRLIDVFGVRATTSSPAVTGGGGDVRPTPTKRGGFGQIVTPEPVFQPTTSPQTFISSSGECTCVEYHKCDPNTNMTINDGSSGTPPNTNTNTNNNNNNNNDPFDVFGLIDIRFDPASCTDVLDVCCIDSNRREESIQPPPIVEKPNRAAGCGIRNVGGIDFKITGATNNEAGFGEFPWVVALIRISDDECSCAGSLIHPKAVLTGNHCVLEYISDPKNLKIRAGEWDTQTTKERLPYQERSASRIFSHPNYNPRSLGYNFAIIELENPFELDDHIATVCLPPDNYVSNSQECIANGWGKDVFGKAGKYSVIMKKVPLPLVPFNECQTALQNTRLTSKFRLDSTFICAGGVPGIDTCEGDGGAPLVCPVGSPNQNRYSQNGIVSWGIGCNQNLPAVYAKVSSARSWIDGQIRFLGLDPNYYTY